MCERNTRGECCVLSRPLGPAARRLAVTGRKSPSTATRGPAAARLIRNPEVGPGRIRSRFRGFGGGAMLPPIAASGRHACLGRAGSSPRFRRFHYFPAASVQLSTFTLTRSGRRPGGVALGISADAIRPGECEGGLPPRKREPVSHPTRCPPAASPRGDGSHHPTR